MIKENLSKAALLAALFVLGACSTQLSTEANAFLDAVKGKTAQGTYSTVTFSSDGKEVTSRSSGNGYESKWTFDKAESSTVALYNGEIPNGSNGEKAAAVTKIVLSADGKSGVVSITSGGAAIGQSETYTFK